jgi:hypothetical protein
VASGIDGPSKKHTDAAVFGDAVDAHGMGSAMGFADEADAVGICACPRAMHDKKKKRK